MFSETQFEIGKIKRPLMSSFGGHYPQTSQFEPEVDPIDLEYQKENQIERPNSLINLKNSQPISLSNGEKKLNPCAANFFVSLDAPGSDSKLIKKPQKKTLRVSESDSKSYYLDPNRVAFIDSSQIMIQELQYMCETFRTSILKEC